MWRGQQPQHQAGGRAKDLVLVCRKCNKPGHYVRRCPSLGRSQQRHSDLYDREKHTQALSMLVLNNRDRPEISMASKKNALT